MSSEAPKHLTYARPPRPVAGWLIFALSMLVRAWALPFAVISWVVGTIALACALGFALAWESPEFKLSRKTRDGKPAPKHPKKPYYDWNGDDDDDDDDDY